MNAVAAPLALKRDLLTGTEWSPAQLRDFFRLSTEIKAHPDRYRTALGGSMFVMIFEKPSLRTRVTFETGIASMGGSSTFLDHTAAKLSEREPVRDIARNLERWVQGIVARVFAQEVVALVESLADHPRIGRVVPEYADADLRERVYQNYRVVYELRANRIEIVAVVHGARNFKKALSGR